MGAKKRKDERRRCSECGRKYRPEPRSRTQQRTCGKSCRLERRSRQARERYKRALTASRESARTRKQRWRKKRHQGPAPPSLPFEVQQLIAQEMGRLSSEGWLARARVEDVLRRVARRACSGAMSRAGLGANSQASPGG